MKSPGTKKNQPEIPVKEHPHNPEPEKAPQDSDLDPASDNPANPNENLD